MFVAAVPPPDAARHLAAAVEAAVVDRPVPLRWTPREQWHLTLAFLPAVPDGSVPELTERLRRAASRRQVPGVRVAAAGAFPRPAAARVLWAGAAAGGDRLRLLAAGCRAAARRAGVEVAEGPFRPHLTLARLSPPRDVSGLVAALAGYTGPPWTVAEVHLVASFLGQGPGHRARHETVAVLGVGG